MSGRKRKKNRRKKQERNLYSFSVYDRRRKPDGYPLESICPSCSRAIVENGELCGDCNKDDEGIKWDKIDKL